MPKMNLLIAGLLILSTACSNSDDNPAPAPSPVPGGGPSGGVESVTPIRSNLSVELNTDKACYAPGEAVRFTASEVPAGARIRYRSGAEVVKDEPLTATSWTWTPAGADFTGYMAEVYRQEPDHSETVLGTIAVDVSSDWTRFQIGRAHV